MRAAHRQTLSRTIAGAAIAAVGVAAAHAAVPFPDQDPFYTPPANLASLANGSVIRTREVTLALPSTAPSAASTSAALATGALMLSLQAQASGYRTSQILFKSTDGSGNAVAEAATLVVPTAPYLGLGTRPLVAYQFAEDAVSVRCEPSYFLQSGAIAPGSDGASDFDAEELLALSAVAVGDALVMPDHEGPNSEWLAGPQSAHAVLDAVRAVLHTPGAGLSPSTKVAFWGYSGGGGATAWAAVLKQPYAPELNVVGAAVGASSNADLTVIANHLDGGPQVGYVVEGIVGTNRAAPGIDVQSYLTPQGRSLLATAADPNKCMGQEISAFANAGKLEQYTVEPSVPITQSAPGRALLVPNSIVGQPALKPSMPVLNYHDQFDDTLPVAGDNELDEQWCAAGSQVEVERTSTPIKAPQGEIHYLAAIEGALPALNYIQRRFAGAVPRNDCPAAALWSNPYGIPYLPFITQ